MTRIAGIHLAERPKTGRMVDPVLVGIVIFLAGFVFFGYLLIRRTFTEFREGARRGRGND